MDIDLYEECLVTAVSRRGGDAIDLAQTPWRFEAQVTRSNFGLRGEHIRLFGWNDSVSMNMHLIHLHDHGLPIGANG